MAVHIVDDAGYHRWRARIPFTNEEIAAALDRKYHEPCAVASYRKSEWLDRQHARMIARVLAGHLTGSIYSAALPYLVQRCSLCGKKALYRIGSLGRCREHRDVPAPSRAAVVQRFEQQQGAKEQRTKDKERRYKRRDSMKRFVRDQIIRERQ
jgi:hypothetical protein